MLDPAINHFDLDHFLNLIQCEHLQTIALILSYLEPAKGTPIIQALPEEVRTDIIRRIICMNHTNPEITRIAERILERHCAPCNNLHYSGGLDHAVKILNLVSRDCKEQIIEFLEDEDPKLAEEIKKRM